MSDQFKDGYYGEINQDFVIKNETLSNTGFTFLKPNHNITFTNNEGYEVGTMDFNGPGLVFEGIAEESAIVFMDWVSKVFHQRLKEEYDRGFADGKASQTTE
jgi:hypothetical protein